MFKELMTPENLAERWNINVRTLSQWRWRGCGPKYLKLGHRVMYRIVDIQEFEDQKLCSHTASLTLTQA